VKHAFHLIAPGGHRGFAPNKTALSYLVDGSGNKHMPKIKDEAELAEYLEVEYIAKDSTGE